MLPGSKNEHGVEYTELASMDFVYHSKVTVIIIDEPRRSQRVSLRNPKYLNQVYLRVIG